MKLRVTTEMLESGFIDGKNDRSIFNWDLATRPRPTRYQWQALGSAVDAARIQSPGDLSSISRGRSVDILMITHRNLRSRTITTSNVPSRSLQMAP